MATITTEGDEVKVLGLLVTLEAGGHGGASSLHPTLRKSAKDGAPEGFVFGWERKGGAPGLSERLDEWNLWLEPTHRGEAAMYGARMCGSGRKMDERSPAARPSPSCHV